MDLSSVATQFKTSFGMITGNLPKARLFIRKKVDGNGNAVDTESAGLTTNSDVSALRQLTKKKKNSVAKKTAKKGQVTAAELTAATAESKTTEAGFEAELNMKGFLSMEVQYNPATLRLNTVAGWIEDYTGIGDKGNNQLTSYNKNVSTYLTVTLVFEDIENSDAFGMGDNFGLSLEGMKSTVKSTVTNLINSDGYSVKWQVEALISLLVHKRTRQVIFYWSEMFFHGELMEVNANYTMFNKKGHPIKAEVTLVIQQADSSLVFKSDEDYWDEAFTEVFGQSSGVSAAANAISNVASAASAIGNLL